MYKSDTMSWSGRRANTSGYTVAAPIVGPLRVTDKTAPLTLYGASADVPVFSVDGAGNITSSGTYTGSLAGGFSSGSVSAPGITFASDTDTGFYNPSTDSLSVTTGGVLQATWSSGLGISNSTQSTSTTTGALRVAGGVGIVKDLWVGGNLNVSGTTTTLAAVNTTVADKHLTLNAGYTTAAPIESGLVSIYEPTATTDTSTATGFTAGVAATSNPTVSTTGAATFTAADIIQVSDAGDNNGIYEVLTHIANLLTVRGVGTSATTDTFLNNQFVASTTIATITKVSVSILQVDAAGDYVTGRGSTTPITYMQLGGSLTNGAHLLTSDEVTQLANINATTISTTQWGYLGSTDQALATTSNVTHANTTVSQLIYTGATTANKLIFPTNLADGFNLSDGSTEFMKFVSTTGSQSVDVAKNLNVALGVDVTGDLGLVNNLGHRTTHSMVDGGTADVPVKWPNVAATGLTSLQVNASGEISYFDQTNYSDAKNYYHAQDNQREKNAGLGESNQSNSVTPLSTLWPETDITYTKTSATVATASSDTFSDNCYVGNYMWFYKNEYSSGGVNEYHKILSNTSTTFTFVVGTVLPDDQSETVKMRVTPYKPVISRINNTLGLSKISGGISSGPGKPILYTTGGAGVSGAYDDFILYNPTTDTIQTITRTWGSTSSYNTGVYVPSTKLFYVFARAWDTAADQMLIINPDDLSVVRRETGATGNNQWFASVAISNNRIMLMPKYQTSQALSPIVIISSSNCSVTEITNTYSHSYNAGYYDARSNAVYSKSSSATYFIKIDLSDNSISQVGTGCSILTGNKLCADANGNLFANYGGDTGISSLQMTKLNLITLVATDFTIAINNPSGFRNLYGGVLFDGRSMWIFPLLEGRILRFDPSNLEKIGEFPIADLTDQRDWVCNTDGKFIYLAGRSNYISRIQIPFLSREVVSQEVKEINIRGDFSTLITSEATANQSFKIPQNGAGVLTNDGSGNFSYTASNGALALTSAEVTQLANINTTTISATQWGYLGVLNQSLTSTSSPTFTALTVTGNVDGRDVSVDGATLDNLNTALGLGSLIAAEVTQLANINATTISTAQWGYLGALDQALTTTSSPTFAAVTMAGATGSNTVSFPDNLANAMSFQEGTNRYLTMVSTDGSEKVNVEKDAYLLQELDVTGHAAIGATSTTTADAILKLSETMSAPGLLEGMDVRASADPASAGAYTVQGIGGFAIVQGTNYSAGSTVTALALGSYGSGVSGSANLDVSGVNTGVFKVVGSTLTAKDLYGARFFVGSDLLGTTGTIAATNAYVICGRDGDTGMAVTNHYGLHLEEVTRGSTLNYTIFTEGGLHQLGGDTEIVGDLTCVDINSTGYTQFTDMTAPANGADETGRLYKKTGDDGLFWLPDSGGAEVDLTNSGGGSTSYDITPVTSSTYTVLETDDQVAVRYTNTGTVAITLPTISSLTTVGKKLRITITDEDGNASANNIVITRGGTDTIIGANTLTISGDYNSYELRTNGVDTWYIM
jgi:hypothetical protein